MNILIVIVVVIILTPLIWGIVRSYKVEHDSRQKVFENGSAPKNLDGFYKGSANFNTKSWIGKSFDKKTRRGMNNFKKNGKITKAFPFKTYTGLGIRDKNTKVLKIDYNIPENPLWLRMVLDELVEIAPNKYLGKAHLRLIPGLSFTLVYFALER